MPTLLSSPNSSLELERLIASTLAGSMQNLAQSIREAFYEPMRNFQEDLGRMLVSQNNIGKMLAEQLSLRAILPKDLFIPIRTIDLDIYEGMSTVEGKIEEARQIETNPLPTITPRTSRSKMGLKQISGGNFSYKRKTLAGLSSRNKEGRILEIILKNSDLFVSDETIDEKFYTLDTLGRSELIKLLKNKFKLNGLKVIIKRQGEGYILININPNYIN